MTMKTRKVVDLLLDHHRESRSGFPEAIYGAGKTPEQITRSFQELLGSTKKALATSCSPEALEQLRKKIRGVHVDELAKMAWVCGETGKTRGTVAILAAGTSDLSVAQEAAITLEFAGYAPRRFFDIGVAGIHRLFDHLDEVRQAEVVIAVAGMEGALPSVVGGLVSAPLIAVPTSIGY